MNIIKKECVILNKEKQALNWEKFARERLSMETNLHKRVLLWKVIEGVLSKEETLEFVTYMEDLT